MSALADGGGKHTREAICTQQQWLVTLRLYATHCGKLFSDAVTPLFSSGWENSCKEDDCGWKFHFSWPTQLCGLSLYLLSFNSLELLVSVWTASGDREVYSFLGRDVFHVATNSEHSCNARCSPATSCLLPVSRNDLTGATCRFFRPSARLSRNRRTLVEKTHLTELGIVSESYIWLKYLGTGTVSTVGCQPCKIHIVCKPLCAMKPQSHYFHVTWTYNFCQGRLS